MKKQTKSFTVIELLVVLAIFGLLASLIMIAVKNAREKAKTTSILQFSATVKHSLGSSMIGEWRMDNVNDSSSYSNNCTNYGSTPFVDSDLSSELGKTASFNGSTQYFSCGNNKILELTANFTVEAWVKSTKNDLADSGSYNAQGIVAKANLSGDEFGWMLDKGTDNKFHFRSRPTAGGYVRSQNGAYSNSAYTDNSWHHIVGVNKSGVNYIYIDGVKQNATQTGATDASTPNKCGGAACNLVIGTRYSDSPGSSIYSVPFTGNIDEVRVYSEGMTTSQIQQLYAEGLPKHQNLAEK